MSPPRNRAGVVIDGTDAEAASAARSLALQVLQRAADDLAALVRAAPADRELRRIARTVERIADDAAGRPAWGTTAKETAAALDWLRGAFESVDTRPHALPEDQHLHRKAELLVSAILVGGPCAALRADCHAMPEPLTVRKSGGGLSTLVDIESEQCVLGVLRALEACMQAPQWLTKTHAFQQTDALIHAGLVALGCAKKRADNLLRAGA